MITTTAAWLVMVQYGADMLTFKCLKHEKSEKLLNSLPPNAIQWELCNPLSAVPFPKRRTKSLRVILMLLLAEAGQITRRFLFSVLCPSSEIDDVVWTLSKAKKSAEVESIETLAECHGKRFFSLGSRQSRNFCTWLIFYFRSSEL